MDLKPLDFMVSGAGKSTQRCGDDKGASRERENHIAKNELNDSKSEEENPRESVRRDD